MSEQHKHAVPEDNQPRNDLQSSIDQIPSSTDVESNILARLGLGGTGTKDWQKKVRKIEQRAEKGNSDAVDFITVFLNDPHEAVRMAAVRGLLRLDKRNPGIVPPGPFIDKLYDKHPHVRATAVEALTAYGAWVLPNSVLEDLMKKLVSKNKSEDKLIRMLIVHLLASLCKGTHLHPMPPTLEDNMYYSGVKVYTKALQSLMAALQDDDWQVRETAVISLGPLMNRLAGDQLEQLDAMLLDDNSFVREAARLVLKDHSLEERLRYDLLSSARSKQGHAALVLGEMGDLEPDTQRALLAVAQNLQAKNEVRESALLALAELRSPIDEKTLSLLLNDRDESVREAALLLRDALDLERNPPDKDKPGAAPPNSKKVTDFEQFKKKRRTRSKD